MSAEKILSDSSSIQRHFLINEKRDWYNARNYCRQYYTDLASVRNEEEQALIRDLLAVDQLALIGLYRYTWSWWSDGSSTTFENWAYRYPRSLTENCAATVFNATQLGKWVANDCAKKINFVCQSSELFLFIIQRYVSKVDTFSPIYHLSCVSVSSPDKKRIFRIKLMALKSTIDLNDPAVTEAALNLIEKKMNETGIGKQLKISWVKKPDNSIFNKEEKKTDVVT
ncbi:hypothetical protein L3Q82_016725 [Scortum barcoo]|uniref:Uncharacterized protein n=1 Tax=Scortum barcoo TaxID=214431 RepID=A0ACB8X807_9TELE|nr:hypothetical protein L3Q82_016725 [Scortum barcoo]